MKKKSTCRKAIAILLACSILSCTTDDVIKKGKQTYNYTVDNVPNSYTGEELFKGIYFLKGNVAETLAPDEKDLYDDELNKLDTDQLHSIDTLETNIIQTIKNDHPDFFKNFRDSITSGDHYQVQEILEKSMYIYEMALMQIPGVSELSNVYDSHKGELKYENFVNSDGEFDSAKYKAKLQEIIGHSDIPIEGTCIVLGIVILAGVVIVAAVVAGVLAAVGAAVGVYLYVLAGSHIVVTADGWYFKNANPSDKLKAERFIDEITISFNPNLENVQN